MSGEAVGELIAWVLVWVLAGLYGIAMAITAAMAEIGRRWRVIGLFAMWAHERTLDRVRNGKRAAG